MDEYVILVDHNDKQTGIGEKTAVHREGKLHRAFSIFVFNSQRQLLLQKRAETKYHCGGLWSNTCCSHPRPGESLQEGAHRRLKEEMGFDCDLKEILSFVYRVEFQNGLTEHEYDHVLVGDFDGDPVPNPNEVDAYKWIDAATLKQDVVERSERYTHWLKALIDKMRWDGGPRA